MAVLTNAKAQGIGTSVVTLYTTPVGKTDALTSLIVCNVTASDIKVTVKVGASKIGNNLKIPAGASFEFIDGTCFAVASDAITVVSDTAASCDAILSFSEM